MLFRSAFAVGDIGDDEGEALGVDFDFPDDFLSGGRQGESTVVVDVDASFALELIEGGLELGEFVVFDIEEFGELIEIARLIAVVSKVCDDGIAESEWHKGGWVCGGEHRRPAKTMVWKADRYGV